MLKLIIHWTPTNPNSPYPENINYYHPRPVIDDRPPYLLTFGSWQIVTVAVIVCSRFARPTDRVTIKIESEGEFTKYYRGLFCSSVSALNYYCSSSQCTSVVDSRDRRPTDPPNDWIGLSSFLQSAAAPASQFIIECPRKWGRLSRIPGTEHKMIRPRQHLVVVRYKGIK